MIFLVGHLNFNQRISWRYFQVLPTLRLLEVLDLSSCDCHERGILAVTANLSSSTNLRLKVLFLIWLCSIIIKFVQCLSVLIEKIYINKWKTRSFALFVPNSKQKFGYLDDKHFLFCFLSSNL